MDLYENIVRFFPTVTILKKSVGMGKGPPKKGTCYSTEIPSGTKYLEDKKWWRQLDRSHYEGKSCEYEQISYARTYNRWIQLKPN
jgi:hypothetical protein